MLCSLKPVILANDDYDDDITHLKQVACDEFLANNGGSLVNVSNLQSLNVTADNVEDIFLNINAENTQESIFQGAQPNTEHEQCNPLDADNLIHLVRTLPKELYINEILKLSSSDRDRLEDARIEILNCIQNTDGYPYGLRATLKKRIQTRTGDSIEYKLAQDLYCLSLVLDGVEWDDLKEVVNVSRSKKSSSQAPETSFQAYKFSDLENLKKSVSDALADIVLLKQENKMLKTEMQSELKSVRASIQRVTTEVESELKEVRSLISANALSIDRIVDEKSNGLACIKSGMKQIKSDFKSLKEEPVFSINISQVEDCIAKFSKMEKKVNRLDKRLQSDKFPTCIDLTKRDSNDNPGQVASECEAYHTVHVNKADNTALLRSDETNLFSRLKFTEKEITREQQKQCMESSALTMEPSNTTKRHKPSVSTGYSGVDKRMGSLSSNELTVSSHVPPISDPPVNQNRDPGMENESHGHSVKTYADAISAGRIQGTASLRSPNNSQYVPSTPLSFIPTRVNGATQRSSGSELGRVHSHVSYPRPEHAHTRTHGLDSGASSHAPTRATCSDRDELDYNLLQNHVDVRRRSKRFYVGGFRSSITHEELIQYVESKGLVVTWVHIWPSKRSDRAVIRLNVEVSGNCLKITEPGFWPRGVKCRPWLTNNTYKNTYLTQSRSQRYRDSDNFYRRNDKYINNSYPEQYNVTGDDYCYENSHSY